MNTPPLEITTILGIIIFVLCCGAAFLFYIISIKNETVNGLIKEHQKLMRSFNDLDEQARLIVHTDLELHKIREEMDKRLNGLNALQRISRHMSQALNEDEIFKKISSSLFEDLGFTRVLIASENERDNLKIRLNMG